MHQKNIKKKKKAIEVLQGANQYLGIILNFFQKKIIGKIMHLIKYQLLNMTRGYQIKPFKEEELIDFLKFIDPDQSKGNKNWKTWQHKRDLAIIYFIYSTGLRISEVLQFKFSDTPFNDQIKVIGKGKKERYVPILPIIKDKISKYIEAFQSSTNIEISSNDPLFLKINSKKSLV